MKKQTKRMAQSGALFAAFCMVPFSQVATAEVSISGWINEGMTYYDDGVGSDIVQSTDNGTTLASRITFAGSSEVASGVTAGFEVITEPIRRSHPLITANQDTFDDADGYHFNILGSSLNVGGSWGKLTLGRQSMPTDNIAVLEDPSLTLWSGISPIFRGNGFSIRGAEDATGDLALVDQDGSEIWDAGGNPVRVTGVSRAGGVRPSQMTPEMLATYQTTTTTTAMAAGVTTVTVTGTGMAPTAADLALGDPRLVTGQPATLPASAGSHTVLTPNALTNPTVPVWGDFLNCFTEPGLRAAGGIGIDCNGVYRSGIRYDLPALGPVSIAVGAANDDIYDIAAKYKGQMGRLNAQLAVGYAINQGVDANPNVLYDEAENFQLQAGLMDSVTGLFGTVAYQYEEVDLTADAANAEIAGACVLDTATGFCMMTTATPAAAARPVPVSAQVSDESDAWWIKVGIKRQFTTLGDTAIAFDYGLYNDQYSATAARSGVTGSEVTRIGVSIDQYFGDGLIIYGKWENLELDVDGDAYTSRTYNGGQELDTFTLGFTYFF